MEEKERFQFTARVQNKQESSNETQATSHLGSGEDLVTD